MVIKHSFCSRDAGRLVAVAGLVSTTWLSSVSAEASVLVEPSILRQDAVETPTRRLPSTRQNIVDVAGTTTDFSTLLTAMNSSNVSEVLRGEGPFTVFAPTNAAFAALPPGTLDTLLLPENRDLLVKLLYNHVGYGEVTSDQLSVGPFDTFDGDVAVDITPNGVTVDGASVLQADVPASNGVIHSVNTVLLPTGFSDELQARLTGGATAASGAVSGGDSTRVTQTSTLQETAIDRSAPVVPQESAPAASEPPVRGLW